MNVWLLVSPPTAFIVLVNVYSVTNPLSSNEDSDGENCELLVVKSTKSNVSKTTELFSQAAGITVGTYLGQEYSWIGYLGGGVTSGLGLDFARRTTENVGESLKSINISHHHGSGTSTVFSLYWSTFPLGEIVYTAGTGFLSSVTRGTLYRIMSDTLVSSSTLTLNDNNVLNGFNNINKTIYIYAISSVRGTELTMLKC